MLVLVFIFCIFVLGEGELDCANNWHNNAFPQTPNLLLSTNLQVRGGLAPERRFVGGCIEILERLCPVDFLGGEIWGFRGKLLGIGILNVGMMG